MTPQQYGPLIGIGIALIIILLRNRAPRTLTPERMWIMPLIFLPLMAFGLWGMRQAPNADLSPYATIDWIVMAVSVALGVVAGWQRGRLITIKRVPDGTLKAQASPIGLVLIVALIAGRQALRPYIEGHAANWGLNVTAAEQAFLMFAVGLIVAQRIEMYFRARRIQQGGTDSHVEAVSAGDTID